jgi:hypothetical protein
MSHGDSVYLPLLSMMPEVTLSALVMVEPPLLVLLAQAQAVLFAPLVTLVTL